jgi:uncharacterized membrane protein YbhN (UPF0104 family)
MDRKDLNQWLTAGGIALLIIFLFRILKYILFGLVFIFSVGYYRRSESKKRQSKYFEI